MKVKYIKIHVYEYTEQMFLIETESRNTQANSEQNMAEMASDGPSPIPLRCALAFPPPSHWDATIPSPCWGPHFVTASCSRIPLWVSRASLPPWRWATTLCRLSLCLCTSSLSCSLQPLLKLSLLSLRPSLLQFVSESRKSDLWTCVCFYPFLFCLCFYDRNDLQL